MNRNNKRKLLKLDRKHHALARFGSKFRIKSSHRGLKDLLLRLQMPRPNEESDLDCWGEQ